LVPSQTRGTSPKIKLDPFPFLADVATNENGGAPVQLRQKAELG